MRMTNSSCQCEHLYVTPNEQQRRGPSDFEAPPTSATATVLELAFSVRSGFTGLPWWFLSSSPVEQHLKKELMGLVLDRVYERSQLLSNAMMQRQV
jgi:hypothetical protein